MKTRSFRREEEEDESMPRVIGWSSDLKTMLLGMENPLPNATMDED